MNRSMSWLRFPARYQTSRQRQFRRQSECGLLLPSDRYLEGGPKLVWLTANEYWEPSVQAMAKDGTYEREMSTPEKYEVLDIPCWRFTVEFFRAQPTLHYPVPNWVMMLKDAQELGSSLSQWLWWPKPLEFQEAHFWEDGQWTLIKKAPS